MKIYEIVGVYDFQPIEAGDTAESFKFRVEVLQDTTRKRRFVARVYRRETFRIAPTFPISDASARESADHEIFVVDDMIGSEEFTGTSKASVVAKVEARVKDCFKVK